jgi:hypothetical protein
VTRPPIVAIDPRSGAAYGIEGSLPVGAIIVTAGTVLRVRPDGGIDVIGAGGHPKPGIASDPTATARRP